MIDQQVLLEELITAAHNVAVHVVLLLVVRLHAMKRFERFAAQIALHAIRFATAQTAATSHQHTAAAAAANASARRQQRIQRGVRCSRWRILIAHIGILLLLLLQQMAVI